MNQQELAALCQNAADHSVIRLEKQTIHVWSDQCPVFTGCHLSNTASFEENPRGERPVPIFMKDKTGVTLDGGGTEVVLHGVLTPFLFDRCRGITLKNFTFDYAHPTMSEFTILENDGEGGAVIRVAADSLFDIVDGRLLWHGEPGGDGAYLWQYGYRGERCLSMLRDPETEETRFFPPEAGRRFPSAPEFQVTERLDSRTLRVRLREKDACFPAGNTVQTRDTARTQAGGCFHFCKDAVLENVAIRAMNGFGILAQCCENVTFRGLDITPGPERTIASNADFLHVSGCRGRMLVENCVLAQGHDDFVNVHGVHLEIVGRAGKALRVRFPNPNTWGFPVFAPGDRADFICRRTLLPYGGGTVEAARMMGLTEMELTFREEPAARVGDCVENASAEPEIVIRGNHFGPSMGRGILCTSRGRTVIEDNVFYRTGGAVLCVCDDCNFWYESGYAADVVFRRNRVEGCGYGPVPGQPQPVISVEPQVVEPGFSGFVHGKIAVTDNDFSGTVDKAPLADVKWTQEFLFAGNRADKTPALSLHCVGRFQEGLDGTDF